MNHNIYNLLHESQVLNSDTALCLSQEKEDLIPLDEGLKNFVAGLALYEINNSNVPPILFSLYLSNKPKLLLCSRLAYRTINVYYVPTYAQVSTVNLH